MSIRRICVICVLCPFPGGIFVFLQVAAKIYRKTEPLRSKKNICGALFVSEFRISDKVFQISDIGLVPSFYFCDIEEIQMGHSFKITSDDEILVGIFKEEDSYDVRIMPSLEPFRKGSSGERRELVYCRPFSEVLLALGYRDILRKLSIASLKSIIRKANPEEKNLLD